MDVFRTSDAHWGGHSPVSLFDILHLARDSLLWRLYCYFLLFVGRLLASLLFVRVCVYLGQSWDQEKQKTFIIQHGKVTKAYI